MAQANDNPRIYSLDVVGNDHISTTEILGVVSNTKIGEPLDPQKIQLDMRAIFDLGFFSDIQVNTEKIFDGIKLNFVVVENPPFKEVKISGLTKVKPEELQGFFSQKSGEIFNTKIFGEDLVKLKNFCREQKGLFVESRTPGVDLEPDGTVNLELMELKYGKTVVLGLVKTKEQVVRRELSFKEGDIIDYNELGEDYARLTRLRLFDSIDMRWEKSLDPEKMDLVIEVQEALTGTFEAGVSYGEQTGNIGGFLKFTEGNLMGLGQSVSIDVSFDSDSDNIQFTFYEPWLDDKHTSFGLSLWNSETEFDSTLGGWSDELNGVHEIDLDQTGISLSFGRQFWKDTTARLKLNFEENIINEIRNQKDEVVPRPEEETLKHPLHFWDNSVALEIIRNKLVYADSQFVSGGKYYYGGYTVAGNILGGEFNYNKYMLEGKWFKTLAKDLVWGARLQGTYLTGDYPDYNRLYLGGMYKLRGYDGDRYADPENAKLIGNQTVLFNTELRYRLPMNRNIELVLFYDAGCVDNTNTADNYGFGVRVNIPFLGMLRFDQAWGGAEDKFLFSIGEMF
ncbi:MAG: BamA/TamA family outer membrane protein [Firmicutes bacterium]|nr:BamA/TamA family outer membrane protein [Bacillota bacterium]